MGDLKVQLWERYGKRRLYVNDGAGRRVGWVDLTTGVSGVEQPHLRAQFEAAVAGHLGTPAPSLPVQGASEQGVAVQSMAARALPAAAPEPSPAWTDLAPRRPGQGVREEAQAQLATMRERTRVGTFIARAMDLKTDERAFRIGADGEESVGARLEKLVERGWRVLHSVPVGNRGSDIDHVLIGPGGVYTINTKNHPGKSVWVGRHAIKVDGFSQSYLRNSRFEAQRAGAMLTKGLGEPVEVRAVLVMLTGTLIPSITYKQQPDDVSVLDRMDVPGVFKRAPTRLQPAQVERIYEIARRSTTWVS